MFAWLVMLDPWPSMPSLSGRPPHAISLNPSVTTHPRHGSALLSRPEKAMLESAPPGQANARSGAIRARAPHTAWLMRRPPSWRAATAAGGSGLTKHPGGAVIVIGRKKPEGAGKIGAEESAKRHVDEVRVHVEEPDDRALDLRRGAVEVDVDLVPGLRHRRHDRDAVVGDPVVVHMVGERPGAVGKLRDRPARQALRVVEEVRDERAVLAGPADPFDEREQLALPDPGRGHLGEEVAEDGVGRAYRLPRASGGWSRWAFPGSWSFEGGMRSPSWWISVLAKPCPPGNASPDVRVVADGADMREHGAVVEHRPEEMDVGEVLGSFVRVVGDEEVARIDVLPEEGKAAGERGRHAAEVNRVAHALADEVALGGEHGGREVPAESHDGRARGLVERDRHRVGDPLEGVPDDLQTGRVELSGHRPRSVCRWLARRGAEMTRARCRCVPSVGPAHGRRRGEARDGGASLSNGHGLAGRGGRSPDPTSSAWCRIALR